MKDITDSPNWQKYVVQDKEFAREPRNQAAKLSLDGFPLFKTKDSYSCWACASVSLNRPPDSRSKAHNINLHWLTTGGKEPQSLQAMMEVLVDDFLEGWKNGFVVFDAARGEEFCCRVKLLLVAADWKGTF